MQMLRPRPPEAKSLQDIQRIISMIEQELQTRLALKEPPTEAEVIRAVAELTRLRQENKALWRAVSGER